MQVMTMQQTAEVMVHSYPKMPVLEDMWNTFAAERGFPAVEDIVAHSVPPEAEWTAFWQYTKRVDPDYTRVIEHLPLHQYSIVSMNDVFSMH